MSNNKALLEWRSKVEEAAEKRAKEGGRLLGEYYSTVREYPDRESSEDDSDDDNDDDIDDEQDDDNIADDNYDNNVYDNTEDFRKTRKKRLFKVRPKCMVYVTESDILNHNVDLEGLDKIYKFGKDNLLSIVPSYDREASYNSPRMTVSFTPPGWSEYAAESMPRGCDDVFFTEAQDGLLMPNRLNPSEAGGWYPLKHILSPEQKLSSPWKKIQNWWDTGKESPSVDICSLWEKDARALDDDSQQKSNKWSFF